MTTKDLRHFNLAKDIAVWTSASAGLKILGFLHRVVPVQVRPGAQSLDITHQFPVCSDKMLVLKRSAKEPFRALGDGTMTPPILIAKSADSKFITHTKKPSKPIDIIGLTAREHLCP